MRRLATAPSSWTVECRAVVVAARRNEFFAAHSPFWIQAPGKKAPPLRNENYGFSLGGPIIKNKAFYFMSYEKQQYIIGLSGVATEPSDAWIAKSADLLKNPGNKYGSYAPVTASTLSCTNPGPTGCSAGLMASGGFWPRADIGGLPGSTNNFFSSSPDLESCLASTASLRRTSRSFASCSATAALLAFPSNCSTIVLKRAPSGSIRPPNNETASTRNAAAC